MQPTEQLITPVALRRDDERVRTRPGSSVGVLALIYPSTLGCGLFIVRT